MFFLVDAFTADPFRGNPAGVYFIKDFPEDDEILKQIALYYGWPEIAYLKRLDENSFFIRWFAPLKEAPLCGHATMASSHVIFSNHLVPGKTINFKYLGGDLKSELNDDETITMTFPAKPVHECKDFPFSVEEIFGIRDYVKVLKDDLIYIVVLKSADDVKRVCPNIEKIKKVEARSIAVTARGDDPFDFTSRYFPPRVGMAEDPVCGSMHCRLTHYWAHELGKNELYAFQASKRTGTIKLRLLDEETVTLTSKAKIIANLSTNVGF